MTFGIFSWEATCKTCAGAHEPTPNLSALGQPAAVANAFDSKECSARRHERDIAQVPGSGQTLLR